jgi:hypothetical protein
MSAGINSLTHRQKVDRLITDLHKQGVSPYTVAPPLFRLLWALGLEVPPPFFLGFLTLTLLMGTSFGILWGALIWGPLMWLLPSRAWHSPAAIPVMTTAGAALLFGLSMAAYYRWKAARLRLPPWESYPGAMPKILPSRKASQLWIRFWIPVLVSLGATPILLCLGFLSTGAGHGTYFLATILFPFTMMSGFPITTPFIWLGIIQFPIYGVILGFANAKRKLILGACVLLAIHGSAIGSVYASSYYRIYKYKHDPNNQLEEAVRNNDVETARGLLDQGVDPNYHGQYGPPSLLFLTCINGHREMAKLLLEKGAEINYVSPTDGETVLFVAVLFRREEIVQLLLSKGADLTVKNRDGFTVLERTKQWRESRETSLKRTKREPEVIAEELQPDDRIISLLEAATKNQKKP